MSISREYSPEFQQKAVKEVAKGDRSVPDIAREFGISASTLRHWVKAAEERKQAAHAAEEHAELMTLRDELKALRAEVEELRKDREFVDSLRAFLKEREQRT
ncbi:MAG: transposase [Corynebacterium sp.]|nr:transposase [Corynebacterium sp.]